MEALLGSCPKSIPSVKSSIRCYQSSARAVLKKAENYEFPPSVDDLVAWSALFRCHDTFGNYLSYARLGCMLVSAPTAAFDDPAVKRAKKAVRKRQRFVRRQRMFIQLDVVEQLVDDVLVEAGVLKPNAAMLFLASYIFLLRLPSEVRCPIVGALSCTCAVSLQGAPHSPRWQWVCKLW